MAINYTTMDLDGYSYSIGAVSPAAELVTKTVDTDDIRISTDSTNNIVMYKCTAGGNPGTWRAIYGSPTGDLSAAHVLLDRNDLTLFPNGVNLGALTTGLLKQTVSAGIATISIAVAGTDYSNPIAAGAGIRLSGTNPITITNRLFEGDSNAGAGQTAYGGVNAGEPLVLRGSFHASNGPVNVTGVSGGTSLNVVLGNSVVTAGNFTVVAGLASVSGAASSTSITAGGIAGQSGRISLETQSGNFNGGSWASAQIALGYNGLSLFRQNIRTRHEASLTDGNSIDFYTWIPADGAGIGSLRAMSVDGGNIYADSLVAGGIVKANVTTGRLVIATAGTDYSAPIAAGAGIRLSGTSPITITNRLFEGLSGGITIYGGTAAGETLTIHGSFHASNGRIDIPGVTAGLSLDVIDGFVDIGTLSAGGMVKAASSTGRLSIGVSGTDYAPGFNLNATAVVVSGGAAVLTQDYPNFIYTAGTLTVLEPTNSRDDQIRVGLATTHCYTIGRYVATGELRFYGNAPSANNGYIFDSVDGVRMTIARTTGAVSINNLSAGGMVKAAAGTGVLSIATMGTDVGAPVAAGAGIRLSGTNPVTITNRLFEGDSNAGAGQTIYGGVNASEPLVLRGSFHASNGPVNVTGRAGTALNVITGQYLGGVGSESAPTYAVGSSDGGMFELIPGVPAFASNGRRACHWSTSATTRAFIIGQSGSATDLDTYLYMQTQTASANFRVTNGLNVIMADNTIAGVDGGAGGTTFGFQNARDSGMYYSGSNVLSFSTGGTRRVAMSADGIYVGPSGTFASPSVLIGTSAIGLYEDASGVTGIAGNVLVGDGSQNASAVFSLVRNGANDRANLILGDGGYTVADGVAWNQFNVDHGAINVGKATVPTGGLVNSTVFTQGTYVATGARGTALTAPGSATVYIQGAPILSGSWSTYAVPTALWVDAGIAYFNDELHVGGNLGVGVTGTKIGAFKAKAHATTPQIAFFNGAYAGIQTVSGSRAGNAALASLLTALAAYNQIVDATTA